MRIMLNLVIVREKEIVSLMQEGDRLNTKQAIQHEFIKLYSEKSYDNITIKELCEKTPVARTTFYSYYQNLDELRTDIETTLLKGLTDITSEFHEKDLSVIDLHDFFKYTMCYIKENWDVMYAFLIQQPNLRFIDLWKSNIKIHFKMHYLQKHQNDNYELLSEMVASSAIHCYRYWMQHPKEVNSENLLEMIHSTITSMTQTL